jgi:hypothetical protein
MTALDETTLSAIEVLDRETYPVELCDERIRQAEEVLANPENYPRRDFFDARRSVVKWTRRREAAIAWRQVKHAAEYLFDFAARMPGFWTHDLTSPARAVFSPALIRLGEDAPFVQCDRCHRKSWDAAERRCGMIQPDGTRCEGTFR